MTQTTTIDPHLLTMTCYPQDGRPHERYEVTVEATGEIIISGALPFDNEEVRKACRAYHERVGS